jgi:hypothetical protein
MAALRLAHPGQPIRYLELGPARGRISVYHYGSVGGPIREQENQHTRNARLQREHLTRYRTLPDEPCGKVMRKGGTCAQRRGHLSHCKRLRAS